MKGSPPFSKDQDIFKSADLSNSNAYRYLGKYDADLDEDFITVLGILKPPPRVVEFQKDVQNNF